MTETTTTIQPSDQSAPGNNVVIAPADFLLHLVVTLLSPMFLCASQGNIAFARMAALEAVNGYRSQTQADLVSVAQIIAFGLTALGSLGLSMADNLSLSMILRLRNNANALSRSAEQNRRSLIQARPSAAATIPEPPPASTDPDEKQFDEALVIARVAEAQRSAAEARSRIRQAAQPAPAQPAPAQPAPAQLAPTQAAPILAELTAEQRHQAMWAGAIADIAGEYTAGLDKLPARERRAAALRASALSSSVHALLTGEGLPPQTDPFRLKPR